MSEFAKLRKELAGINGAGVAVPKELIPTILRALAIAEVGEDVERALDRLARFDDDTASKIALAKTALSKLKQAREG